MIQDSPKKATTLIAIDVSHAAYRAWYANETLKTSAGVFSGHVYGVARMLNAIFRDLATEICPIFCYDGAGAKAARQEILPEYKANRTPLPINPLPDVKLLCSFLPGLHIEKYGREGDDAIAWACELGLKSQKNVVVYSGDKDLWSLIRPGVKVFYPSKGKFITEEDIFEKFHVKTPNKVYLAKALFGDDSDDIKGVFRLIKKQVEPVLEQCDTPEALYRLLETKPDSMTKTMYEKTLEAKEKVIKNYQVIIPRVEGFNKGDVKQVIKNEANKNAFADMLRQYECYSVLEDAEGLYK